MVISVVAPKAATYTQTAAALSTTSQVTVFLSASGQPGAGSQLRMNLPGSAKFNGRAFKLLASGTVLLGAGTYTATVQPLVYASATNGFTAAVSNAIYSSAAVASVGNATLAKYHNWSLEIPLTGWDGAGEVAGIYEGYNINAAGTVASVARTKIDNPPTSVDMDAEPALQFAVGVTLLGANSTNASTILTLTDFRIEG